MGAGVTWLRLDDEFVEHDKIEKLTDRAFRLHVAALCHCARRSTDGFVSPKATKVLLALVSATKRHINELIRAELWRGHADGYVIKDYLDYNPDSATVKAQKARNAARQADLRKRRNEIRDEVDDALRNALPRPATNAAPSPTPTQPPEQKVSLYPVPEPQRDDSWKTNPGTKVPRIERLLLAAAVPSGEVEEARIKLFRALKGASGEDVDAAINAVRHDTKDRLGMILAVLKRRKAAA